MWSGGPLQARPLARAARCRWLSATFCGARLPARSSCTFPPSRCERPVCARKPAFRCTGCRETPLPTASSQTAVGADGHAEVLASPLAELCAGGDLPLQPALMGNLVPQQLNLWMGAAQQGALQARLARCSCLHRLPHRGTPRAGASSGLHHDFHDNLYVLLRGRKHLRLYPPSAVAAMYPYGRPRLVHGNGRIVYAGQVRAPRDQCHIVLLPGCAGLLLMGAAARAM